MSRGFFVATFMLATLLVPAARAQTASGENEHIWRGTWAASAGPRTFHGRWWAQLLEKTNNAASGSWTLLSDSNQILLEGTWSARKLPNGWNGTWSARVGSGRPLSGTWSADAMEGR